MTMKNTEELARQSLKKYLIHKKQWNSEDNLNQLMEIEGGYLDRFNFFMPYLNKKDLDSIFISGCSVGSELLLARKKKFKKCIGLEIDEDLARIGNMRLKNIKNTRIIFSKDGKVPIRDKSFSFVYSGHVIEHTSNPFDYFNEKINLVRPGGFFFIEFPNRYNLKELHTGTISFEWAPYIIRNFFLLIIIFISFFFNKKNFIRYKAVLLSLKPISVSIIKKFIKRTNRSCKVIALSYPARGYVRMLLKVSG
jgi:SAM-dependent methyltransferase